MAITNIITIITNQKKTDNPMGENQARAFSDAKHASGDWNTRVSATRSRLLRFCADFLSQKRRGVDDLAAMAPDTGMVLDAGAGRGAYSVWFAARGARGARNARTVVSVDISFEALKRIADVCGPLGLKGKIRAVCADLHALPFREERFCAVFSVDTLGHVADVNKVLDELHRCASAGAPLFLHSECADYRRRWPDRMLIRKLGKDLPALADGHENIREARELFMLYTRRFRVLSFFNPAGYFGWFLGYPEKYCPAFAAAGLGPLARFCAICASVKRMPVLGLLMRLKNALTNHCENFLGLTGGGSCFALVRKPT
jgi:SAM-dependent methyltransferase